MILQTVDKERCRSQTPTPQTGDEISDKRLEKAVNNLLERVLKPLYVNCKSQFVEDLVQMRKA